MKTITSESNPDFKRFLKLTRTRGIKKLRLALLSGPKQVQEVLNEFQDYCDGIVFSDKGIGDVLVRKAQSSGLMCYCLSLPLFNQLDLFGTDRPLLLIHVNPLLPWGAAPAAGCTLCVPFQDPANVGAVIRSAAAFGVSDIVMLEEAAHPWHPRSVRAAGTTLFRIPLHEGPSISDLKQAGFPLITLSAQGRDVKDDTFPDTFCLVPGIEGPGLPESLENEISLSIPMEPGIESINAATATGIMLYVWRNAVRKKGSP